MRKLIVHMMTTLDGFIADEPGEPGAPGRLPGDWTNYDDEMRRFTADLFTSTDTLMFGRGIYQEFVPHWTAVGNREIPGDEHEVTFGGRVRDARKVVVSTTLGEVPADTTVLRGDLTAQVGALKAAPGSDILCYCGPDLLATLAGLGLIDEYMLYVHPLVIGRGVHLFGSVPGAVRLELARTRTFDSGTVLSYYRPR